MPSIAVLMTCFDRKQVTLQCLRSLQSISLPPSTTLEIYLVDDASPDGTGAAVQAKFPAVRLLKSDGQLYWGGGMRLAFAEAINRGHDYYLWLNDDVELRPDAIVRLAETSVLVAKKEGRAAIIVGATCDPEGGTLTYSGQCRRTWHPLRFEKIAPDERVPVPCDAMNGNVVLIPAAVVQKIGNIDGRFTHQIGDFDYALRAQKSGIGLWICPGFVGTCRENRRGDQWKDPGRPLRERFKIVNSARGLPFREWMLYSHRHGGLLGIVMGLVGYRELIFPKRRHDAGAGNHGD